MGLAVTLGNLATPRDCRLPRPPALLVCPWGLQKRPHGSSTPSITIPVRQNHLSRREMASVFKMPVQADTSVVFESKATCWRAWLPALFQDLRPGNHTSTGMLPPAYAHLYQRVQLSRQRAALSGFLAVQTRLGMCDFW